MDKEQIYREALEKIAELDDPNLTDMDTFFYLRTAVILAQEALKEEKKAIRNTMNTEEIEKAIEQITDFKTLMGFAQTQTLETRFNVPYRIIKEIEHAAIRKYNPKLARILKLS